MPRIPLKKTPDQWKSMVEAKKADAVNAEVDNIYNQAAVAINSGNGSFDLEDDSRLEYLPSVNALLFDSGFKIIRGLGKQVFVRRLVD